MATKKKPASKSDPGDVDAYIRDLDHQRKEDLESLRRLILDASPPPPDNIVEGIKWNSPSFRTTEYFATINVHAKDQLRLVLHTGAKASKNPVKPPIDDPLNLMTWLAADRCLVSIGAESNVLTTAKGRAALTRIIRAWIKQLPPSKPA